MKTVVKKWGNSLGIRIPKSFASEARIAHGVEVDISVQGGRLVIKALKRSKYSLDGLLAQVTPENLHDEADFGDTMGKEVV